MMNENDLQKIIDTVIERLRGEYDLVPKRKATVEPEAGKVPFRCDKCGFSGLLTFKEAEQHQRACSAPSELEATISRLAAAHEEAFQSSPNDRAHYRLCQACRREFLTIESFNHHSCCLAGRVLPVVLADHSRPGQSERTAAAMQAERKRAILEEATEILNGKI